MDANFEQFRHYNDQSFEEGQNVVYKSTSANNNHITFECRAPKGSVLLADPVLETNVYVVIQEPQISRRGKRYGANSEDNATVLM